MGNLLNNPIYIICTAVCIYVVGLVVWAFVFGFFTSYVVTMRKIIRENEGIWRVIMCITFTLGLIPVCLIHLICKTGECLSPKKGGS